MDFTRTHSEYTQFSHIDFSRPFPPFWNYLIIEKDADRDLNLMPCRVRSRHHHLRTPLGHTRQIANLETG
jgi:hypothetical protein